MLTTANSTDEPRPYPPTCLTSEGWRKLPTQTLPVDLIVPTQNHLRLDAIIEWARDPNAPERASGDHRPHVVCWQGRFYLENGHHRFAIAIARGHRTLCARVYRPVT